MIADYFGNKNTYPALKRRVNVSRQGLSFDQLSVLASSLGMTSRAYSLTTEEISEVRLPAILHWNKSHFVVLESLSNSRFVVVDPGVGRIAYSSQEFSDRFSGFAIEVEPGPDFETHKQNSDRSGSVDKPSNPLGFLNALRSSGRLTTTILLVCLLLAFGQVFSILNTKLLSLTVDEVIIKGDEDFLLLLLYMFGLVLVLQATFALIRVRIKASLQSEMMMRFPSFVFAKLMGLKTQFIQSRSPSDVQRKLAASQRNYTFFLDGWPDLWVDLIFICVFALLMLWINQKLGAIVLLLIGTLILIRMVYVPIIEARQKRLIEAEVKREYVTLDAIQRVEDIKAGNLQHNKINDFLNTNSRSTAEHIKIDLTQEYLKIAQGAIASGSSLIVAYIGAYAVMGGQNTIGDIFAFVLYRDSLMNITGAAIDKFVALRIMSVEVSRVTDIIDSHASEKSTIEDSASSLARGIREVEACQVAYSFGSLEEPIFSDFSLSAREMDRIVIYGPPGSGKSTILRIMIGMLEPSAGVIRYNGMPTTQLSMHRIRELTGYVRSDPVFAQGSILENIISGSSDYDEEHLFRCTEALDLHQEISSLPSGYMTQIGECGLKLSSGQAQRLAIAKALYRRPDLLLLDEPTSHLDERTKELVIKVIREFKGIAIIVTHDESLRSIATACIAFNRSP